MKSYFRQQAAFGFAFPPRGPVEHHDFILKLLEDAAREPADNTTTETYLQLVSDLANANENLFEKLSTFVRYYINFVFLRTELLSRLCMERDS